MNWNRELSTSKNDLKHHLALKIKEHLGMPADLSIYVGTLKFGLSADGTTVEVWCEKYGKDIKIPLITRDNMDTEWNFSGDYARVFVQTIITKIENRTPPDTSYKSQIPIVLSAVNETYLEAERNY